MGLLESAEGMEKVPEGQRNQKSCRDTEKVFSVMEKVPRVIQCENAGVLRKCRSRIGSSSIASTVSRMHGVQMCCWLEWCATPCDSNTNVSASIRCFVQVCGEEQMFLVDCMVPRRLVYLRSSPINSQVRVLCLCACKMCSFA